MPFLTKHLQIPFFKRGEIYSASIDKHRFNLIDEELNSISSIIGTGVIKGLEVIAYSQNEILIKSGMFAIDGKIYNHLIDEKIYFDNTSKAYLYVNSGSSQSTYLGIKSNIVEINYTDSSAGDPPSGVEFLDLSPYSVRIKFDESLPADYKKIFIYRSLEGSIDTAEEIGILFSPNLYFDDTTVSSGTQYYYWFKIEDINNLVSEVSDSFLYQSPEDLSIPFPPENIKTYPAHRSLSITWEKSISKNVSHYQILCRQKDETREIIIDSSFNHCVVDNLTNGLPCYFSIRSIGFFDTESSLVEFAAVPAFNPGPRDFSSIECSFYYGPESNQQPAIVVNWTNPFIDPSLTDLSIGEQEELSGNFDSIVKYVVWELRQSGSVSIKGEPTLSNSNGQVLIRSFLKKNINGEIVEEKLKDSSNYIIKLYRVINGRESVGRFVQIKTGDMTPPSLAINFSSELLNDSSLRFNWDNEKVSEIYRQIVSIKKSKILSTTFDYSGVSEIAIKIQNKLSGEFLSSVNEMAYALFGDRSSFPIKCGISNGFLVFEVDESVLSSVKDKLALGGAILGSSFNIQDIKSIAPLGGVYIGLSGLNVIQLKSAIDLIAPVVEISYKLSGSGINLDKNIKIHINDFFNIQNVSSFPDNTFTFENIIPQKPSFPSVDTSYTGAPDSVLFRRIKDGFSLSDINKNITLENPTLLVKETVGQQLFYILSSDLVEPGTRYFITVASYDFANNKSEDSVFYFDTPEDWEISAPQPPEKQSVIIENDIVKVAWSPVVNPSVTGYNIIRAFVPNSGELPLAAEKELVWEYIAKLGKNEFEYYDYEFDYENHYIYRVVSNGLLGKLGPSFYGLDNDGFTTPIVFPRFSDEKEAVSISAIQQNSDVIISVQNRKSNHDGYIIYRSYNDGQYRQIGSMSAKDVNFVDKDVLVFSGKYKYVARPAGSESYFSILSEESSSSGILLASAIFDGTEIILEEVARSAFMISSFMLEETDKKVKNHKHLLVDEVYDLRVSLSDDYEFENFETDDNQVFLITDPLPSLPSSYNIIVLLNGAVSPIPYNINLQRRLLKFSSKLAPTDSERRTSESYDILPKIKLVIRIDGETSGILEESRLSSVFAQQISSGKVKKENIPQIIHSGISGDIMEPIDCICESVDGFKYIVTLNEDRKYLIYNRGSNQYSEISEYEYNDISFSGNSAEKVGFGLNKSRHYLIYDAFHISGTENFIFATSRGVYYYNQRGSNFEFDLLIPSEPPSDSGPCHKLVYMTNSRLILCINFRSFDILTISSSGGVSVLHSQLGFNFNCQVFRDAAETSDGSIFVSSNIGIFKVEFANNVSFSDINSIGNGVIGNASNIKVSQIGFISGRTTDIYALWTSEDKKVLYASTDIGVFYSSDFGKTFKRYEDLKNTPRLWSVTSYQGTLFAVSDNSIHRKRSDEESFVEIFRDKNISFRKFVIKYGRIIFTTNDGIYKTDSLLYAKYYNSIKIKPIDLEVAENGRRKFIYSLAIFGPYLIACMEGKTRLIYSLDRFGEHIDFSTKISVYGADDFPTVILDNKKVDIGVYVQYSSSISSFSSNDCIFFDYFINENSNVRAFRQYSNFINKNGGWARRDFGAPVFLYKNNIKINDGSRARKPFNQIAYYSDISHSLDDTVSYLKNINSNIEILKSHAVYMLVNKVNEFGNPIEYGIHRFTRNNIRKLIENIDNVNKFIYDDDDVSQMGIVSSLRLSYPQLDVDFIANVLPSPYGVDVQKLNKIGIGYSNYEEPTFEGSLGTYDPEDPTYYIPPVPIKDQIDGVDSPNYEFEEDDDVDENLDIPYSGFYGENAQGSGFGSFGGRRTPSDGDSGSGGPPPANGGGVDGGDGSGVGGGLGGGFNV